MRSAKSAEIAARFAIRRRFGRYWAHACPAPDADAVRAQLERILASPGFANADRLSRFLRFVVERTLDGEGDQLKEYRLGTEVFDRPSDYDPRLDSIVRVEARRLRSKLAEYYEGPGRADPVVIRVEKGGYAATFEAALRPTTPESTAPPRRRPPTARPGSTAAPSTAAAGRHPRRHRASAAGCRSRWPSPALLVAVLAAGSRRRATPPRPRRGSRSRCCRSTRYDTAADVVPEALADAVTDGLIAELARHPAVEVASRTSVMPFRDRRVSLSTIAPTLGVQAVVEGRVQVTGTRLWVEVRLVDARRDRKVWVDDFAGDTSNRRELERRVAAALVPGADGPLRPRRRMNGDARRSVILEATWRRRRHRPSRLSDTSVRYRRGPRHAAGQRREAVARLAGPARRRRQGRDGRPRPRRRAAVRDGRRRPRRRTRARRARKRRQEGQEEGRQEGRQEEGRQGRQGRGRPAKADKKGKKAEKKKGKKAGKKRPAAPVRTPTPYAPTPSHAPVAQLDRAPAF